jgi:hypothetical protein
LRQRFHEILAKVYCIRGQNSNNLAVLRAWKLLCSRLRLHPANGQKNAHRAAVFMPGDEGLGERGGGLVLLAVAAHVHPQVGVALEPRAAQDRRLRSSSWITSYEEPPIGWSDDSADRICRGAEQMMPRRYPIFFSRKVSTVLGSPAWLCSC